MVRIKRNGIVLWRGLEIGRLEVDRTEKHPVWTFKGTCKEAPETFSSRKLSIIRGTIQRDCLIVEDRPWAGFI